MELVLWIVALVASIAITHFYFQRSGKSLSFYLLLDDQPLSRVDLTVRERLSIVFSYPEAPGNLGVAAPTNKPPSIIGELQHLQVIVSNSGVKAITFSEAPTIEIPHHAEILDTSVIYQNPDDLNVEVARPPAGNEKNQIVRVALKMLNKGEFVVIKFLLSEAIRAGDLKLHLLAEDLPRNIAIKPLPPEATKSMFEEANIPALVIGFACALCSIATAIVTTALLERISFPSFYQVGFFGFFKSLTLLNVVSLVSFVSVFFLLIFAGAVGFGIGAQPIFRRHRIVLPVELRPNRLQGK